MILKIVKYPDPVLAQPGEPVTEFNAELRKFVADMFETMYDGQGIGLAAQQVGVAKRLLVIDLSVNKVPADKLVLINPEIISAEGRLYEEEGCLSFPDIREKVPRTPRCASARRTSTANGSRWTARMCSRAASSMKSTTWTACCSSSA
jgi:peptide deformylase